MSSIESRIVLERLIEARQFLVGVFGNEIGDHDARIVQHHLPKRDAVGEADALEGARAGGDRCPGPA